MTPIFITLQVMMWIYIYYDMDAEAKIGGLRLNRRVLLFLSFFWFLSIPTLYVMYLKGN